MIRKAEYLCVFLAGGVIYGCIEILWRGYTHWSMTLAGAVCLLSIHVINQHFKFRHLTVRCLAGCIVITTVEFIVGVVVNRVLGLNVWDYSAMPGNILGQICPIFSVLWFLISIPACALSNRARMFFEWLEKREQSA